VLRFADWISRTAVDAVLWVPDALVPPQGVAHLVSDTMAAAEPAPESAFDLVVGNPPYGRVGLPPVLRERYRRSLYGQANLHGIFTKRGRCVVVTALVIREYFVQPSLVRVAL
jgi:adenine-specific DNA-methyltransferase